MKIYANLKFHKREKKSFWFPWRQIISRPYFMILSSKVENLETNRKDVAIYFKPGV